MPVTVQSNPSIDLDLAAAVASLQAKLLNSTTGAPGIGNGTTAGTLRTTAASTCRIKGVDFTRASTDDLWDLSGETDTLAGQFRAYWLYSAADGTASFVAGANAASAAGALAALPDPDDTLSIVGVYVAGAATDFSAALAAQGTIYDSIPAGANIGVTQKTFNLDLVQVKA